jgi:hypothetical protein
MHQGCAFVEAGAGPAIALLPRYRVSVHRTCQQSASNKASL